MTGSSGIEMPHLRVLAGRTVHRRYIFRTVDYLGLDSLQSAKHMLKHRTRGLRASIRNGLTNGGDDLFHHLPVLHAQIAG